MDSEISRPLLGLDGVLYIEFCCNAIWHSRWLLSCSYMIVVIRENEKKSQQRCQNTWKRFQLQVLWKGTQMKLLIYMIKSWCKKKRKSFWIHPVLSPWNRCSLSKDSSCPGLAAQWVGGPSCTPKGLISGQRTYLGCKFITGLGTYGRYLIDVPLPSMFLFLSL